jgi:adenosylhomocysteine nucleosidase
MRSNRANESLGIVVAMSLEARDLGAGRFSFGERKLALTRCVVVAGQGSERAAAAAQRLLASGATRVLSMGVAGGLAPSLQPGDLLVPEAIVAVDEPTTRIRPDPALRALLLASVSDHVPARSGVLATSAHPVLSAQEKRELGSRLGAVAVDMEAAAVARVAAGAHVPFAAVKAICDPVDRCIPSSVVGLVQGTGRLSARGLVALLARGPSTWRSLAAPARDYAAARRTLRIAAPLLFASAVQS